MRARFAELGATLRAHEAVWRPRPFEGGPLAWEEAWPDVAAWVDARPIEVFDDFEGGWVDATAPAPLRAWRAAARAHAEHPTVGAPIPLDVAARRRLPGRKVSQIEHFIGALSAAGLPVGGRVVDWCAGKGHLGRAVCRASERPLLAVEWDAALCESGRKRCVREGVDAVFACTDARAPEAAALLGPDQTVIALHACGDLHRALIEAAPRRGVDALAVAPCCYNRDPGRGAALSAAGRTAELRLTAADLDLVHREQVVARGRDRRRAWVSMARRLGFDAMLRRELGEPGYRSMPPSPKGWLELPFAEYCRLLAASDGLELPPDLDAAPYEDVGWARLDHVRRRDAVRGLFRATLEAWLVLDRALLLDELGYEVDVGTFCPRHLTPRNAIILATRGR